MEIGPWLEAGRRLRGPETRPYLQKWNRASCKRQRQYCLYVHVPFCASRCSYCALYTFAVEGKIKETLDEYLKILTKAVATHPNAYPPRAPTTVHFGGGTPLLLGTERLAGLTRILRETFGDSAACEWAVETTTSSIDSESASMLKELRFQRIHLGIQTLDNDLRRKINRRESGERALEKIAFLNSKDFLISADLILGFENQTEELLENDLKRLYQAGVRMFSVCELRNLNPTKSRFDTADRNYRLWCLLWNFMEGHELRAIHLGQFGRNFKDNLYYTHPARDEDCIALGPYAHGSSRRMTYANQLLPDYYYAVRDNASPISFGVVYDHKTQKLRDLERELLAHQVQKRTVAAVRQTFSQDFTNLWNWWLEHNLLVGGTSARCFEPTRDGSWYIGNMARQLRELATTGEVEK